MEKKNTFFIAGFEQFDFNVCCCDLCIYLCSWGCVEFLGSVCSYFLLNLENFSSLCFLNICLHPFVRDANYKYVKTLEVVPLFANWHPV